MSEESDREQYNLDLAEKAAWDEQCAARDAQPYEEIAALESRISTLEAALREIAQHPHQDKEATPFGTMSERLVDEGYRLGLAVSHRCAAEIARKALAK